ncbi:MAG: ribosome maturation factor RimP [Cyanobacteriota bacterium]|nr:ribosome maturation factor RimP [Cyanobacteriota bacterium]
MPHPLLPDLETLASATAAGKGYKLCCVQVFTHLIPITIQVQIRCKDGSDVSLDDCAHFSASMDEALEASQLFTEAYVLEISSPGIGDQLHSDQDFLTFRGFPVEISFRDDDSDLHQAGLLHKRSDEHVHINIKGRIQRIPRKAVTCVRLTNPTG